MERKKISGSWKKSKKAAKQRKYKYNAPLHLKQKMIHVHLSSELRKKYGKRNAQVRKNDKVKILRGQHKKKEAKVERVNLKKERVYLTGMEYIKKDGNKIAVAFSPSNLMITELDLSDKYRKAALESNQKVSPEKTKENKEGKETAHKIKQDKSE